MTSEKEKMLAGHFHNEANFAVIFKYRDRKSVV